jgi:uncharacterized membrane protein (DUF2068 family)
LNCHNWAHLQISGLGLLSIVRHGLVDAVAVWIAALHVDAEARWLQRLLAACAGVAVGTWRLLAIGCFLYAALYLVEGYGLWRQRRWAEWLTVVGSSLLVPVEIYELARHATVTKAVVLALNLAIVAYLAHHIHGKGRRGSPAAP